MELLYRMKEGSSRREIVGKIPVEQPAYMHSFAMKQLYELEPFIKVKPYLTNQWEKGGRVAKHAS